jgi:hypothetical protein
MALKGRKRNWAYKLVKVDADAPTEPAPREQLVADLLPSNMTMNAKAEFIIAAHVAVNGHPPVSFEIKHEGEMFKVRLTLHRDSKRWSYNIERPVKILSGGSMDCSDEMKDAIDTENASRTTPTAVSVHPKY